MTRMQVEEVEEDDDDDDITRIPWMHISGCKATYIGWQKRRRWWYDKTAMMPISGWKAAYIWW